MRALFKENVVEAVIGLVVVIVAIGFVVFAYGRTQAGGTADGYVVKARFTNVAGVSPGTDVRMAGIRVGKVAAQSLDPSSFQAVLDLSIDKGLKLPVDSSAAITTEGILGGTFIALTPGGDEMMLKPGEEIIETSGATDLMALIGGFVNKSGGDAPAAAPATEPAAGAPTK
ncbi:outer membrane lipid asymmetry maintenance protein MlaD [Polymorphobacter fuscus]|uniref:Outer membrane lipid asymmetry maintenance protein MlaD n=1 Tax=Sandarakinorhabdus fusca TaxID=1439888 RepID=A0A7C9GND7_9SPHN|nr:outer membrane lipid asymmetry maintenance protein MlaD [Polymorphobacter fuscus]KAB7649014.1 outer membrane lipid asymmetry maintenance protein MlaD [Polymorphobacter fuscus]MQT16617.1 outer membrane lipid asymmetry maintenance protein MlaD [Polymorphobacter fuscus]NJC07093.1 phospholipid/cholesterol/gamma-HCH transport system substrate-binding protein [Polymorphobacter fuscus]